MVGKIVYGRCHPANGEHYGIRLLRTGTCRGKELFWTIRLGGEAPGGPATRSTPALKKWRQRDLNSCLPASLARWEALPLSYAPDLILRHFALIWESLASRKFGADDFFCASPQSKNRSSVRTVGSPVRVSRSTVRNDRTAAGTPRSHTTGRTFRASSRAAGKCLCRQARGT